MNSGFSLSPIALLPQGPASASSSPDSRSITGHEPPLTSEMETDGSGAASTAPAPQSQPATPKSFGQLLDSHAHAAPAPQAKNSLPASSKTAVPSSSATAAAAPVTSDDAASDGATDATVVEDSAESPSPVTALTLVSTLVMTQLQASGGALPGGDQTAASQPATTAANDAASTGAAITTPAAQAAQAAPLSESDALAQLQQLLGQLLQLAQQSQTQPTSDALTATDAPALQKKSGNTGDTKDASTPDALAALLEQLKALVAQLTPQTDATAEESGGSDAPVSASVGDGNAALLAQLTRELGQKLGGVSGQAVSSQSAPATGTDAASGTAQLPASFDATLNALLHNTSAADKLQSLLTQVNDLLAAPGRGKQDGSGDSDASKNADAPAAFLPAASANQAAPASGFAKLVSDSASAPAAPASTQVAVQIKNAVADGMSQIKIQLSPEDLGKVVVQLTTGSDGKTGVTVTADNRQTLALLQNEARSLEASLRDIGLKTDSGSLNFNLSGQQQQPQQSFGKNGGYGQATDTSAEEEIEPLTPTASLYRLSAVSGLDIRV